MAGCLAEKSEVLKLAKGGSDSEEIGMHEVFMRNTRFSPRWHRSREEEKSLSGTNTKKVSSRGFQKNISKLSNKVFCKIKGGDGVYGDD